MWLAFYNNEGIGDVLLLTSGNVADDKVKTATKDNVTVIYDEDTDEAVSVIQSKVFSSIYSMLQKN